MKRRTLLTGGLLGLLLPFTTKAKAKAKAKAKDTMPGPSGHIDIKQDCYSPYHKGLGKAVKANISTEFDMEKMFEQPRLYRYVKFPIEIVIEVEYENGREIWTAFNVTNTDIKGFNMKDFLMSKFIPGEFDYGGHFKYLNNTWQLSSIMVNDGIQLEKW